MTTQSENLINFARGFAIGAHGDQKYGAGMPYYKHLDDVYAVLGKFGFTPLTHPVLCAAAYLHDVLEDTPTTPEYLKALFGDDVLTLVQAVTNEPGENRKARHEKTYPKIRKAGWWAMALKLADRIANVEASLADTTGGKIGMYRKEHEGFKRALYTPTNEVLDSMWNHLNNLMEKNTPVVKVYVALDGSDVIRVFKKRKDADSFAFLRQLDVKESELE